MNASRKMDDVQTTHGSRLIHPARRAAGRMLNRHLCEQLTIAVSGAKGCIPRRKPLPTADCHIAYYRTDAKENDRAPE